MKKTKGKYIKEVKYSPDEWNKVMKLSKQSRKLPAAYIRQQAVEGKILRCFDSKNADERVNKEDSAIADINNVAKTVNIEKAVYANDVKEIETAIDRLGDMVENDLEEFEYTELENLWLWSVTSPQ